MNLMNLKRKRRHQVEAIVRLLHELDEPEKEMETSRKRERLFCTKEEVFVVLLIAIMPA